MGPFIFAPKINSTASGRRSSHVTIASEELTPHRFVTPFTLVGLTVWVESPVSRLNRPLAFLSRSRRRRRDIDREARQQMRCRRLTRLEATVNVVAFPLEPQHD
jgi:hypothetical protein